jgi:hypothetical protein
VEVVQRGHSIKPTADLPGLDLRKYGLKNESEQGRNPARMLAR